MGFSITAERINNKPLIVDLAEKNGSEASPHWFDYLLNVLIETAEDIPGKNLQPRSIKAEWRKDRSDFTARRILPFSLANTYGNPAHTYKVYHDQIPVPGYYTSLSLLYVF
jgi:hypothetical protein